MSKLKYGMAAVGAIAASVGVAALSLPQALAQQPMGTSEDTMDQQSYNTQRATTEYQIQKQECDTLKYNQPQSYEPCMQKAKSTRDNLRAQGSEQVGQGSQGYASNQSGQSGQKQGPIDKVTSVVKEKLVDWGLASPDQGQPSAGQQGQGSQQGSSQGRNPLQASFDGGQGTQGQAGQQSFGGGSGSGQGGQNVGQQGVTQGQQFQAQQGQSGQGSFQGGNYGQQPQGQSGQQGTGGANQQQFQSGGTQGPQGSSSQQAGSTSGSPGGEEEHMDSVKYYQELARQQYGTLKQECNALKKDPSVYEQCQTYAKSIRDKITGMAEENQRGG